MFLEYGVNEADRYVHISQVNSGRVPLACPYCGQGLIARKGQQKEHHFAHDGDTCREANKDFESLNIPYFDRFDLHLDAKTWTQLQYFNDKQHYNVDVLMNQDLIRLNTFGRRSNYELTDTGKIPFGLATLSKFADFQLGKIYGRHTELSDTVQSAHYGRRYDYDVTQWMIEPAPDMVMPAIADLNIYRSQVARVFNLDLYLLLIEHKGGILYKIGVSTDIERRIDEIRYDLRELNSMRVEQLRVLKRRGAVERYALYRYRDYQHPVNGLTEYFEFDKRTRSNVLRDFTSLGDYELAGDDNRYLPEYGDYQDIPRFTQRGLITSILEGSKSPIEVELKPYIAKHQHSQATRAGMERAKESGIHIGRPKEDESAILDKYPNVIECLEAGMSLRKIANQCDVSVNTVRKIKALLDVS